MLLLPAQGFGRVQAEGARRHHHHHYHARNPGCRTPSCDHRVAVSWAREHPPKPRASAWAIPAEIVRCESGYQNEAPNYAGAAGWYQLTEWSSKSAGLPVGHSGYANEHSKAEQDIVAAHLYAEQGTGPWVSSEGCWGGHV